MFFTPKLHGEARNWAGPPLFVGWLLRIGQTATQYPPGEWVEITVYARGHGPGGRVMVFDQGPASLIRGLAAEKRGADTASTDIYCEVDCVGDEEKAEHRGTPTWDGDQLEIDGNVYPLGKWSKVTVFSEGWAAHQQPQPEPDPSTSL
jgi:hypothetical protein